MRRCNRHKHDLVARPECTNPMNDAHTAHGRKPKQRSVNHRLDGAFGHARVMLQFEQRNLARVLRRVSVPHGAHKAHHRANTCIACAQASDFAAIPGHGVSGRVDGREVLLGNAKLMTDRGVQAASVAAAASSATSAQAAKPLMRRACASAGVRAGSRGLPP